VLLGVGLGTLTWYGGFSTAVALLGQRVGDRSLIGFGGLLGYRTLHDRWAERDHHLGRAS
jgi:hypothetical protein